VDVYLKISLGGESSPTDCAGKRLLPGVSAFMNLQGTGR